jgi:adenylate cyclase
MSSAEDQWHKVLVSGHRPLVISRRIWRHVPSAPRCKVCGNPFAGIGGRVARVAGYGPSRKNPNLCGRCCDALPRGGAEVDIGVLFADVRGSTALGERASASDYAGLLNRFYAVATDALLRHDGLIDKLIGDEAMGLFIPGVAGPDYRRKAVKAALELLRGVGYGSPRGPWLTIGVGVNAGRAYVGNVGTEVVDFTALGDPVNVAARLQASAGSGEIVVAADVHEEIGELLPGATRRTIQVRGHEAGVPVLRARVADARDRAKGA